MEGRIIVVEEVIVLDEGTRGVGEEGGWDVVVGKVVQHTIVYCIIFT